MCAVEKNKRKGTATLWYSNCIMIRSGRKEMEGKTGNRVNVIR